MVENNKDQKKREKKTARKKTQITQIGIYRIYTPSTQRNRLLLQP